MLISWDILAQYAKWNSTMKSMVTLPFLTGSDAYVTDGKHLCGYHGDGTSIGTCVIQLLTGPVFDLTLVTRDLLLVLYKCGYMIAYSIRGE